MEEYPCEADLERIEKWPIAKAVNADCKALLEFVKSRWHWEHLFRIDEDAEKTFYCLSTGGWSGNESLVGALAENMMFNAFCWESSHRGGWHMFSIRKLKKKEAQR